MKIEGPVVQTQSSQEEVFALLAYPENYKRLFPAEQTKHFEAHDNSFTFGIGSMPHVTMVIKERIEPKIIVLVEEKGKFPIELICNLHSAEQGGRAQLTLEAKLNPMLNQMLKKPLRSLIDALSQGLSQL